MKKILSTLSAAAMLVAAVALVGCSNPASSETDTIRTIEAPVLSTETFPGVNYISWNKVNGAESYDVYRDGKFLVNIPSTGNARKVLEYADIAFAGTDSIADGVSYEYTVKAIPAAGWFADESGAQSGNAARAVYSESNEASVTIKANVPTAAEFTEDYESYFEKFTGEDPDFKTEFVAVDAGNNDYVRITLPTKPEFEYEVYKYLDNAPNKYTNKVFTWSLYKAADAAREFLAPVTGAGDWNYIVKVKPRAPIYTSKEFAASAKVSVASLNVATNNTSYVSAAYIDAGKTVKVSWNANTDATGKEYAAASYSVYRFANNAWTKLGEVASEKNLFGKNVYFVKDEVADNKVYNYYYVVLSEGKAYANETAAYASPYGVDATVTAATVGNPTAEYIDAGKTVRIVWQPKKNAADTLYGVDSYAVYRKDVGINGVVTYTAVSGKITATTSSSIGNASLNNTTDKYFVTDEPKNNKINNDYVVVLGGVYSANTTAYAYNVRTNPNAPTVSANKFAAEKTDTYQNDVYVTVTPGKSTDTFKLYRRLVSANGITISNVVDADWKEITGLTGPNANGAFVYVDSNLAEGTYQYKAIESAKDYADTAAITTTNVTINSRTITGASISVSKYLAESLAANRATAKFSISVTDTINSNEAAKYTYKVQYSKVEDIDPSTTTTSFTFGAWTDVATLAMVDTSTASLYRGATNITLGKGVYYFRVVKTDSNITEPKYTYSTVQTVDAGFNTDSFSLGTTTAGTQVAITATNANYANYTVKLYKQQNINYNNVSDFALVAQSAFAPIAAGSTTYQATYGTYFTNAATTLEAVTYNYVLIVTDPEGNKYYDSLSNVTIQ